MFRATSLLFSRSSSLIIQRQVALQNQFGGALRGVKTSTGIVGLVVDPNAIENIIQHNQALLDKMSASDMPESAAYRQFVTKIAEFRINICKENPEDPDKVEELCASGQVEELVEQAKDEMKVLDMYLEKRYWEIMELPQYKDVEVEEINTNSAAEEEVKENSS